MTYGKETKPIWCFVSLLFYIVNKIMLKIGDVYDIL